jgi:hypothetical protein
LNYEPTPSQTLLVLGILANHGSCAQAELMPKVKKNDRETLAREKLITVAKIRRGFALTLGDAGWAWIAENLDRAKLPPAHRTLHDLCARLSERLARSGETLADFIGSKPEEVQSDKPSRPLSPAALRKRIEAAYLALTNGRKNEMVRLAHLRAELSDLDRITLDAALGRILKGDRKASLMRHDDPRQLDQTDHDAAFNPLGEPYHVLWISS